MLQKNIKAILILFVFLIVILFIYFTFLKKEYDQKILAIDKPTTDHPLNNVYVFNDIYTKSFCDWIVEVGESTAEQIGGWTTDRHKSYATTDIPVKKLNDKTLIGQINKKFKTIIKPKIERYYKVSLGNYDINDHRDIFVVKYEYGNGSQDHLDFHRDGSIISYVIQLSERFEYSHGGTMFEEKGYTHIGDKGSIALHSGKIRHAGNKISWGKRYILVGFLDNGLPTIGSIDNKWYCTKYLNLKRPFIVRNDKAIRDDAIIKMLGPVSLDFIFETIEEFLKILKRYKDKRQYNMLVKFYKLKFKELGYDLNHNVIAIEATNKNN